jgi:hypothetical protein
MKCFFLDLELHPLKIKILICVCIGSHCANIFYHSGLMVVGWRARWKREEGGEKNLVLTYYDKFVFFILSNG